MLIYISVGIMIFNNTFKLFMAIHKNTFSLNFSIIAIKYKITIYFKNINRKIK